MRLIGGCGHLATMSIIRRLILAFALTAGITPALAQAPPPIPALPDTERRTTYNISATTCICAVGFAIYGDSTDVANWVTVWLNGVQVPQTGNWILSSPTGALSSSARPISDAVLIFTTPQTGVVQIVGARRPRRTSQFTENRGVAARDINQVVTDLEAQVRELWDRQIRTLQANPGETFLPLPPITSRANTGVCFDTNGNVVSCIAIPTSTFTAGNGVTFTGTNPTIISVQSAPTPPFSYPFTALATTAGAL